MDALYLIAAKVDALTQEVDKISINLVGAIPSNVSCEICGYVSHTATECQLGNCSP